MKLTFNPKTIARDPFGAYKTFNNDVKRIVCRKQPIDLLSFASNIKIIADSFESQNKIESMNKISRDLIEFLVNQKQGNLAGIAYSVLIKLNANNPQVVEDLAIKSLAIARRFNDPVHIMARAQELNRIYAKTEKGSEKHIKYLRIANAALKDICKNYSTSMKDRYHNVSREIKPLESYEILLCDVKSRLAQYIRASEPQNARYELDQAKQLLAKNKDSKNTESIKILSERIARIERMINRDK